MDIVKASTYRLPIAGRISSGVGHPSGISAGIYEWIKWSVFRDLPYEAETVIVWVRNDLFIDTSQSLP